MLLEDFLSFLYSHFSFFLSLCIGNVQDEISSSGKAKTIKIIRYTFKKLFSEQISGSHLEREPDTRFLESQKALKF